MPLVPLDRDLHAVLLAGGSGTRFWPWSRAGRPKQFLALAGGEPLLVETWRRARALLEPSEVRQRGKERALRGVLRLVMIAQLVEGVAVHLGQVLPIEGLEAGRVRLGLLDETSVTVEVDETRTTLLRTVHLPECRASHLVTRGPWSVRSGGRG